jgi:two-component system sensor histidine kinase SenX3
VKFSYESSQVHCTGRVDGEEVLIEVSDRGVGIPARDLERIFERFYRVDHGRGRSTGGTGLGLAIVRHVAANHRGSVHVESREGEGSTFSFRLPLQPGSDG